MLFFFPGAHFRAGARFEGPEAIARQIRVVFDEILDFSVILAKMCRKTLFFFLKKVRFFKTVRACEKQVLLGWYTMKLSWYTMELSWYTMGLSWYTMGLSWYTM